MSTFAALSGRVRKNVMIDLAALELISAEGAPAEELVRLAHAVDGPDWDEAVSGFIERRYPLNKAGGLDRRAFTRLRGSTESGLQPTVGFVSGLLETLSSHEAGAETGSSPVVDLPDERPEAFEGERPSPPAGPASTPMSVKPSSPPPGAARPLIQVADGMVQLDGATLASLSDDELQKLAGLLKAFGRLASRHEPTDGS